MDSVSSKKKKRSDGEVEPIISPSLKRSLKGKKRRKHDKSHMSKPSEAESVASEDGETVEECRSSDLEGEVQASCPYPDSTLRIAKGTIFDEEGIEDERLYMEAHTIVYNGSAAEVHHLCHPENVIKGYQQADDTKEFAKKLFAWLIYPMPVERFYNDFWEKKCLIIHRPKLREYYKALYSKTDIETSLEKGDMEYNLDIDVTLYRDGKRETLNEGGAATGQYVWSKFEEDKCSIRTLHPQRNLTHLAGYMSIFEECWQCGAGSNAYLTPAQSQGFAPHYDDVDAYVLQTEGVKHWTLYRPASVDEILPRVSSQNFDQSEVSGRELVRTTLQAGDLCYFPRGVVHQAHTSQLHHSLHLTLSTGYCHAWYDYVANALAMTARNVMMNNPEFRRTLPWDIFDNIGMRHSDLEASDPDCSARRKELLRQMGLMFTNISENMAVDEPMDELSRLFTASRLPPPLKASSSQGLTPTIEGRSNIRLVCSNALRFDSNGEELILQTHLWNNCQYHASADGEKIQEDISLNITHNFRDEDTIFPIEFADVLESLLEHYPKKIQVQDLAFDGSFGELSRLLTRLVSMGLLVVEK